MILDVKALKAGKYSATSDPAQLRGAIADTVGTTIGIDIFYDTPAHQELRPSNPVDAAGNRGA